MKKWLTLLALASVLTGCFNQQPDDNQNTSSKTSSSVESSAEKESSEDTASDEETSEDKPSNKEDDDTVDEEKLTIKDYFKFKENEIRYYEGEANEFSSFHVFPQYIKDDIVQVSSNNGGTQSVLIYEILEDKLTLKFNEAETYYRNPIYEYLEELDLPEDDWILVQGKIEEGNSWEQADGRQSEIVSANQSLSTSAFDYENVFIVETTHPQYEGNSTRHFFAPEFGIIRIENYTDGELIDTANLARTEEGYEKHTIRMFTPDDQLLGYTDEFVEFELETNAHLREHFEELFKEHGLLTDETQINYIYRNPDGAAYIDLSKEYISTMNSGSAGEMMMIQSLVNTVGYYFQTDQVFLTVEDTPYQSGHIYREPGSFFYTDSNL